MKCGKIIYVVNEGKKEEGPELNTGNPPTFRIQEEKELAKEFEKSWPVK